MRRGNPGTDAAAAPDRSWKLGNWSLSPLLPVARPRCSPLLRSVKGEVH
jgi:hypothetical protein